MLIAFFDQFSFIYVYFISQYVEVFFRETNPRLATHVTPVLLLHGAHSSSEAWQATGTIRYLGAMGYRVVALDLPGTTLNPVCSVY